VRTAQESVSDVHVVQIDLDKLLERMSEVLGLLAYMYFHIRNSHAKALRYSAVTPPKVTSA